MRARLSALLALALAVPAGAAVRDVVARADDSVVTIHVRVPGGETLGSGVILDPRGFALTNAHVVDSGGSIVVVLKNGREVPAGIVQEDSDLDLAVLRLSAVNLPTVPVGSVKDLKNGDEVVAIGAPRGLDHTVTRGIVSSRDRLVNGRRYIQTDAALNPGNSGGPLLNDQAQVVGINTMIEADSNGVGFAIPISAAFPILRQAGVAVSADLDNAELPGDSTAAPALPPAARPRQKRFPVLALGLGFILGVAADSLIRIAKGRRRPKRVFREPDVKVHLRPPAAKPNEDDLDIELK
ncbi:MAG TPA: trypsin-like peptidase domain-containing protein [Armatimonadota bacterium]